MRLKIGQPVRIRLSGLTFKRSDDDTFFEGIVDYLDVCDKYLRDICYAKFLLTEEIKRNMPFEFSYAPVGEMVGYWFALVDIEEITAPSPEPDFDETRGDF